MFTKGDILANAYSVDDTGEKRCPNGQQGSSQTSHSVYFDTIDMQEVTC